MHYKDIYPTHASRAWVGVYTHNQTKSNERAVTFAQNNKRPFPLVRKRPLNFVQNKQITYAIQEF